MIERVSSAGSPTQWRATRSPSPASTWRSTQLYAAFSRPPTYHLANGLSDQSSTSLNGVAHEILSACLAQNARRSASASEYTFSFTFAFSASSAGGSNRRSSRIRLERVSFWGVVICAPGCSAGSSLAA